MVKRVIDWLTGCILVERWVVIIAFIALAIDLSLMLAYLMHRSEEGNEE